MGQEDGGLTGAGPGLDLLVQLRQLALGGLDGAVEPHQLRGGVAGGGRHYDLAALIAPQGPQGQPWRCGHAQDAVALPGDGRLLQARGGRGLLLFFPQARRDGLPQGGQGRLRIRALRHDADGRARLDPQVQQGDQALGIPGAVAMAHPDGSLKALGDAHQGRGRAGVQAVRATDDQVQVVGEVRRQGLRCRPRRRRCAGGQTLLDIRGIGGLGQARGLIGVAQDIGQVGQDLQVLVGLGGDPHHQVDAVTRVPLHACRDLEHRHAGLFDQVAVLGHPVRDGDAVAEEGVRHLLAGQQAVHVAGLDEPGIDQDLADLADGVGLVGRPSAEAHRPWIE